MSRPIRIQAVPNEQPDVGLYVLALVALARQLQEEERAAEPPPSELDESDRTDRDREADHD